jgi:hypothetical protein
MIAQPDVFEPWQKTIFNELTPISGIPTALQLLI